MVTMHEVDSARPLRWHSGADWCATRILKGMKTSRQPRYLPDLASIAAYLRCSRRTVQRLVRDAGLPVLSQGRNKCSAVPERIDAWRAQRDKDSAA